MQPSNSSPAGSTGSSSKPASPRKHCSGKCNPADADTSEVEDPGDEAAAMPDKLPAGGRQLPNFVAQVRRRRRHLRAL
jgi:hypothetical protein